MSGLLPQRSPVEDPEHDPQVVGLDGGESDAVFSALSSGTARWILEVLYREPATQSELATELETSIQNVDYHLDKLVGAGLVTVVDSWYSEKGRDMDVYAPAGEPLVLIAGDDGRLDDTRRAVADLSAGETAPEHCD